VPDIDAAHERIYEHSLKLEDARLTTRKTREATRHFDGPMSG
jgi:hypothetical protein